jgi:hypothetical protein
VTQERQETAVGSACRVACDAQMTGLDRWVSSV